MTMTPRQETAKIYQFPVKSREASPDSRATPRPAVESFPLIASDFGSGWYHEAAMRDDIGQGRKH